MQDTMRNAATTAETAASTSRSSVNEQLTQPAIDVQADSRPTPETVHTTVLTLLTGSIHWIVLRTRSKRILPPGKRSAANRPRHDCHAPYPTRKPWRHLYSPSSVKTNNQHSPADGENCTKKDLGKRKHVPARNLSFSGQLWLRERQSEGKHNTPESPTT